MNNEAKNLRAKLRKHFANYVATEGCGCCQGNEHSAHLEEIAKLLNIPKYKDGSGFDVYRYQSK